MVQCHIDQTAQGNKEGASEGTPFKGIEDQSIFDDRGVRKGKIRVKLTR